MGALQGVVVVSVDGSLFTAGPIHLSLGWRFVCMAWRALVTATSRFRVLTFSLRRLAPGVS